MAAVAALLRQGDDLFRQGSYDAAKKTYSKALRCAVKLPALVLSKRAACFNKLKRHHGALRDAHRAVAMRPTWGEGYAQLGAAFAGLGKHPEARAAAATGLDFDPGNGQLRAMAHSRGPAEPVGVEAEGEEDVWEDEEEEEESIEGEEAEEVEESEEDSAQGPFEPVEGGANGDEAPAGRTAAPAFGVGGNQQKGKKAHGGPAPAPSGSAAQPKRNRSAEGGTDPGARAVRLREAVAQGKTWQMNVKFTKPEVAALVVTQGWKTTEEAERMTKASLVSLVEERAHGGAGDQPPAPKRRCVVLVD